MGPDGPEVRVRIVRSQGDVVVGRIPGVTTRNEAERLKGTEFYVARSAMPAPEPDSYYHHDLQGLAVHGPDGVPLGRVKAVHNFGAGDILEVEREGGSTMIPFTKDAVPLVDLAAGLIVLTAAPD